MADDIERPAPEGVIDSAIVAVSLKRYPDTKRSFSALCKAAIENWLLSLFVADIEIKRPAD
jgi:hypothetical protein